MKLSPYLTTLVILIALFFIFGINVVGAVLIVSWIGIAVICGLDKTVKWWRARA